MLRRPLDVVADKQIQQSVAIEIKPQRRRAQSLAAAQPAWLGYIDERALAGVPEQPVLADASNKDVRITVVVVISDRNPHAVHLHIETSAARDVGKCAVAIVAIELYRAGLRFKVTFVSGPIYAVHQKNVLPAVAVVVKKRATGAECFGQQFPAGGAAVVTEFNSR